MEHQRWHLISGEYPPAPGGVSDYTRQLAMGLAERGQRVEVWASRALGAELTLPGIVVHRLDGFSARHLAELGATLAAGGKGERVFVQYVPQAFGARGMNVRFIRWLVRLPAQVWVQFHEVAVAWEWTGRPRRQLLAVVQRWMARTLARRADRNYVSIEAWRDALGTGGLDARWLPIPSNLPTSVPELALARARRELGSGPWIGHFGTYGRLITRDLAPTLLELADRNAALRFLLLGRGAVRFAQDLGIGARVRALENLEAASVAAHLAACDVVLQPFPDGISTRRTSAMAGLALGAPMVTTEGHLTDAIWPASGAVALAPAGDVATLAGRVLDLVEAPRDARALGERGAQLYRERFSFERTLEALGMGPDVRVEGHS